MSDKKESWVTNESGKIVGKDSTTHGKGGESKTIHQDVYGGNVILPPQPGNITGVTINKPDGTSSHKPK